MDKKSSYKKQDLLDIGAGKIFGAKNGKLPIPPMLMIDRILNISETGGKYGVGFIEAEMDINPEHWFFKCHFKNDPVMPGCLGLAGFWQLCLAILLTSVTSDSKRVSARCLIDFILAPLDKG